jgi:DNA-binding CsgD family transcriptional regulator
MGEKNPLSASFYLSHLQRIHDFQEQLTKHMNVLAKRKKSHPTLILDPSDPHKDIVMQDAINNEERKAFDNFILDTQQKYTLYDAFDQPTHLTALEFLSVHLFSQGKSYKTIALLLAISPRTVETYITRAKERTGYVNKYDILNAIRCFKTPPWGEKNDHKSHQLTVD